MVLATFNCKFHQVISHILYIHLLTYHIWSPFIFEYIHAVFTLQGSELRTTSPSVVFIPHGAWYCFASLHGITLLVERSWLEDQQRVWQRSASTCVLAKVTRVDGSKLMVMYFESRIILQSLRWSMHRVAISHVQSSLCWFSPYAIRALQACKCFFCANSRSSLENGCIPERYYASRGATAGSFVIAYLCTVIAYSSASALNFNSWLLLS